MQMRKFVNSLFLLLLLSSFAAAQTVVARKTINLWPDPSTAHEPIAKIAPSVRLRLLESSPTNGFYHVKADDGKEGWVAGDDIVVQRSSPPMAMSDGINPDWAKAKRARELEEKQREMEKLRRRVEETQREAAKATSKANEAQASRDRESSPIDKHTFEKSMEKTEDEHEDGKTGSTKPNLPESSHQASAEKPRPSATPSALPIQRPTTSHTGPHPMPATAPPVTSAQGPTETTAQQNQSPEEKLQ